MASGFLNHDHLLAFEAGRIRTSRGGPDAATCGARTKKGAFCADVPVKGSKRCIRHCGPKAAGDVRERQREAFLSGRLSAQDWHRAEAKRGINRLRDRWKKDPWLAGATIDLGEHEAIFAAAVKQWWVRLEDLPPAICDWLGWKFRRFQIDRREDSKWEDVVRIQLPERTRKAGLRTRHSEDKVFDSSVSGPGTMGGDEPQAVHRVRKIEANSCQVSKRQKPDEKAAPRKVRVSKQIGRGRPRKNVTLEEDEAAEIAKLVYQNREVLVPLLANCRSEGDRLNVVNALRAYLSDPTDRAALARWLSLVRALKAA